VKAIVASGSGFALPRSATTDSNGVAEFTGFVIIGTGEHTLWFSTAGLFATTSSVFTVAPAPVVPLQNGTPVAGVGGSDGTARFYVIGLPAGAANGRVETSGGTGNVDLYVRLGQLPTLTTYDCRAADFGNIEACAYPAPPAGEYYVMLHGTSGYDNVTLTATYDGSATSILIVTGGGTGTGTVTTQSGVTPPIGCTITNGTAGATGCIASYGVGTSVTLTAAAASGSAFTGWSGPDVSCPGSSPCTVIMDGARTVTASLTAGHLLTLVGQGPGSGAVKSQVGLSPSIDCAITNGVAAPTGCTGVYAGGTAVTLAAHAAPTSLFLGWSGAGVSCPTLAPCSVVVDQPRSVSAAFGVAPSATVAADDLLGTPGLSTQERAALDQVGNRNGRYDVGDYLALLDRLGLFPSAELLAGPLDRPKDSPGPPRPEGGKNR
ncbi:MAG: pre-peptidase C-terminal domain-containing protein, partial [Gemmatimonadales bacterium]